MSTEIERFQHLFGNEDDLRHAIVGLFQRMEGISSVQMTHGTQELGKDVVFYARGALGEVRLHACVIKNTKISGTVESTSGAIGVFNQVQQSLDNPYIAPDGTRERVGVVYVISPFEISQAAMNSIQGCLERRSGQVQFFCGFILFKLLQTYWPDFVVFESGIIGAYVNYLHRDIEREDPIASLVEQQSILSRASASFRNSYVKQGLHIDLATFSLSLQIPDMNYLNHELRQADAQRISEQLKTFARFLGIREVHSSSNLDDTSIMRYEQLMRNLAISLERKWETSAEEYRNALKDAKKPVPSIQNISIQLLWTEDMAETIAGAKHLAERTTTELTSRIAVANQFAHDVRDHKNIAALDIHALAAYSAILHLSRIEPTLIKSTRRSRNLAFPYDCINQTNSSMLITAPAGYGKTSFCRWHALHDVEMLSSHESDILPIYVPLHRLATRRLGTYADEFFDSTELRTLCTSKSESSRQISTIRIYLDGLDEIPRLERQRDIALLANDAVLHDSRIQIILTGRDYVLGQWLNWIPRVSLSDLDKTQVQQLVSGLLDRDDQKIREFFREIKKTPSLNDLMSVPLLGTLIVAVFRRTGKIPENRVRLYEMFTGLLTGGWDLVRNVKRNTEFSQSQKLNALQRLAWSMQHNGMRHCKMNAIFQVLHQQGGLREERSALLVAEIVRDGLLSFSGGLYYFSHFSFQEFFAAKDLLGPAGDRASEVLRRYIAGVDWWKEVLMFYIGMASKPEDVQAWLDRTVGIPFVTDRANREQRYLSVAQCIEASHPGWRFSGVIGVVGANDMDLRSAKD